MFSWNDISADKNKLVKHLHDKLGLEWIKEGIVIRYNHIYPDTITIISDNDKKSLSLTLNSEKNFVVLKSDNGSNIQYKFIAEKENDNIKIYRDFVDIPITFAFATFRKRVRFVGTPNKTALSLLELGSVSFKGVDLPNAEFHNVNWLREKELFLITRNTIVDEKLMGKDTSYEDVAKIYNQLRKNYESRLLFNEASHFFVGEMEAIRKSNLKGKSRRKKLYSLGHLIYKYLALYGESAFLPLIIWTPILISLFAIFRYAFAECSTQSDSDIISMLKDINSTLTNTKASSVEPTCSKIDRFKDYSRI
jgi:hypothetical protein